MGRANSRSRKPHQHLPKVGTAPSKQRETKAREGEAAFAMRGTLIAFAIIAVLLVAALLFAIL